MTDTDLIAALPAARVVALTLYGEARSEPIEGMIAVANVIRNRVKDGRYGDDYRGVCLRPWQFSCWNPRGGQANYERVLDAAKGVLRGYLGVALRECVWITEGLLADVLRDNTHGATHYMTTELYREHPPLWASRGTVAARIGAHTFFKGL